MLEIGTDVSIESSICISGPIVHKPVLSIETSSITPLPLKIVPNIQFDLGTFVCVSLPKDTNVINLYRIFVDGKFKNMCGISFSGKG